MDMNKEIRRAVDTGKVLFGIKQCKKEIAKNEGKIIIVSSNINNNKKEELKYLSEKEGKKFYEHEQSGLKLGSICGKPFVVSAMIVLDEGKSNILKEE